MKNSEADIEMRLPWSVPGTEIRGGSTTVLALHRAHGMRLETAFPVDTLFLATDTPAQLALAVAAAARLLGSGEPVALPTETVYGLAADATRADAILKIFEAKERPLFDPLIIHLPERSWLDRITEIPDEDVPIVRRLTDRFWPGPLTLVLPRRLASTGSPFAVPDLATSGLPTVAVRMSAHPVFAAVLKAFGSPLAAPSANRFGRISPTAAAHVMDELAGRIPLILDGGTCTHGVESTIVAVTGGGLEILRSGPVSREELSEFAEVALPGAPVTKPVAPGQLKSHYAPRTPLAILDSSTPAALPGKRCGLLAWQMPAGAVAGFAAVEVLSPTGDLREAATRLFAAMRRLDEAGLDVIVAEAVPEHGLGVAIMDRLRKAAYRANEKPSL